jgi:hypothetical protein
MASQPVRPHTSAVYTSTAYVSTSSGGDMTRADRPVAAPVPRCSGDQPGAT